MAASVGPTRHDIDLDIPLTWRKVLLTICSYLLFFTDIPRSGLGFATLPDGYVSATETIYTDFGPYHYPIIAMERLPNGSIVASSSTAKVWSYKFDTCSVGLRTVVTSRNITSWNPCYLYATECPATTVNPRTLFHMLNDVVLSIAQAPTAAWRINYLFADSINDFFSFGPFKERDWRSVMTHYVPSPRTRICDPSSPSRPCFCGQSWTNFGALGVKGIGWIVDDIQSKMRTQEGRIDARTQRVDMAIVESFDDFRAWGGGVAKAYASPFDVVTLLRVQNCSNVMTRANCSTVYLADYRYEGGVGRTNTMYWYGIAHGLRLAGQIYNIIRACTLLFGCYYARCAEVKYLHASLRQRLLAALCTCLRIPAQVVIYGSWLPVLLFATAHLIDSPFLYFTIYMDLGTLNGSTRFVPSQIYSFWVLLTCHMRNVWVLSLATKGILLAVDRHRGQTILGFRGYLLPCVSFLSVLFETRLIALRNTHIVGIMPSHPSRTTFFLRELHTIPSNFKFWGVYSDLKNLFISWCAVYLVVGGLLGQPLSFQTTVPYSVLRFGSRSMFSTSWHAVARYGSLYHSRVQSHGRVSAARQSQNALLHITWMTDPLQYLLLLWTQPVVFVYRVAPSNHIIYHALPRRELHRLHDDVEHLDCVGQELLMKLPWQERIYCQ
ncbi:hypothetical protein SPRG_02244 [Saprolegnia parasitica CBS 223.65]|uniref:Uncharacterized protein n=1 Tax=Saprolegnia parasitica (strain CBS 223.65) TaxID=695850 RepID=A0A067D325_SAPPC|nr:hypothetical protein SPRG_02244 [Saprolegnia parasitica CBS 223.65]KDO33437.1 hypothetical protein SPRG_02244 [Saprolegnia parasitica CBS 223.65]|eukprot:XP_012196183.1 hypothetical protein SPRG_02244 [Saprolegnia parasitica CBS 223.65]